MNSKKALTGAERARKFRAAHHTSADLRQQANNKKTQRAKSRLSKSKLAQDHERALGRARSQRFRDNEKFKKINERRRKDGLPLLSLNEMRADTAGSSVPPAAQLLDTTEAATVGKPTRRSARLDVSNEHTQNVQTEDSPERLTVSFKFHEDRMKRKASMLKKAQRDLATAQRHVWKLQKEVSRRVTGGSSSSSKQAVCQSSNADSPCSSADRPLRTDDVSPGKTPKTLKRLSLGLAVLAELKKFTPKSKSKVARSLMSSDELRKSRNVNALGKEMQVRRLAYHTTCRKRLDLRRARYATSTNKVLQFLKRPDNSTCMPGKRDTVTIAKTKYQMYVLQDYLEIPHRKFLAENPDKKVSLSYFRGVREKYRFVKLVRHNLMNACLCKTHENMRLLIKATPGLRFNSSPDEFIKEVDVPAAKEMLEKLATPTRYREWCTVPVTYGNVVKKRVKLIDQTADRAVFTDKFISLMHVFKAHVARVIAQCDVILSYAPLQAFVFLALVLAVRWTSPDRPLQ